MSEWISVKDRMPDEDTLVLVYSRQGSYMNLKVDYIHGGKWFNSMLVTHWRPLPDLPENEDDAEIKAFVCTVEDYHGNKNDCRVFANTAGQAREKLIQQFPKHYVSHAVTLKEYMSNNRQKPESEDGDSND